MSGERRLLSVYAATLLFGCGVEPPCPKAKLAPLEREAAYAVVTSEYFSSAIALLDTGGELITEAWIDSGTTMPRVITALSGDVTLATRTEPGVLTLIDRLGVDVVTRIALPEGRVLGQLPASLPATEGRPAFRANPQDALVIEGGRLLVSRHEPNLDVTAPALDRGDDLWLLDLDGGMPLSRIDLSRYDEPGPHGRLARPGRMARAGASVVVGLARLGLDFCLSPCDPAPGAALVVDLGPEPAPRELVVLPGLENCGVVRPVPREPTRVIVQCQGAPFGTPAERRPGAGLAVVEVTDATHAGVTSLWRALEHPELPVVSSGLVPLGGARVFAVAMGDVASGEPDRAILLDLASGAGRVLFEGAAASLGSGAYDPVRGLLLVPDAEVGIRRLRILEGAEPEDLGAVDASPCRRLPPREVAPLRAP